MTGALKDMRENPWAASTLVGLSFAYGVFHAAGPGHGKAVISSYMLANEVALRRGVMLSFVSAFLQAATAIVVKLLPVPISISSATPRLVGGSCPVRPNKRQANSNACR